MAWRAPQGFNGMSFRGCAIIVDDHGCVDLAQFDPAFVHELVGILPSHGFSLIDDAAPAAAENEADDDQSGGDRADGAVTDEFDAMKRGELFAWLREAGVSVMPPIANHELRARARAAKAAKA